MYARKPQLQLCVLCGSTYSQTSKASVLALMGIFTDKKVRKISSCIRNTERKSYVRKGFLINEYEEMRE
jgi:hypothetical protein